MDEWPIYRWKVSNIRAIREMQIKASVSQRISECAVNFVSGGCQKLNSQSLTHPSDSLNMSWTRTTMVMSKWMGWKGFGSQLQNYSQRRNGVSGEMTQWLKHWLLFQRSRGQFPANTRWLTTICIGSVVDSPGTVCVLMLIQLLQEGLPGIGGVNHAIRTSCDPSNE